MGATGGWASLFFFADAAVERGRRLRLLARALCETLQETPADLPRQGAQESRQSDRRTVHTLDAACTSNAVLVYGCIDRKQCCFWKVSGRSVCVHGSPGWVRDGPERFPPVGPAAGARERNRPEAATGAGGGAGASSFAVRAAFSGSHLSCGHARRCCKTLPTTSWRMSRHLRASWLPTARAQRWRRATSKWPSVRRRRAPPARLSPST